MGLDAVELVMGVEDKFGVTISDGEASAIYTVGDMVRLLESRLGRAAEEPCLAMPNFLALRRVAREAATNSTLRVRPSTRVSEALTPHQRRLLWERLPGMIKTTPPGLQPPLWFVLALLLMIAAQFVAILNGTPIHALIVFSTCATAFVTMLIFWARFAVCPPVGYETFGEIAQRIMGLQSAHGGVVAASQEEILSELRPLITDLLGVKPDEVHMESRFIKDLGMG